jgi:cation diffusion facilitator family transporter
MSSGGSIRVILGSLAANLAIATAKGVAAFVTGSGSMLGEAIHSSADCMNQVLLLVGAKQAERPPSEAHPLGQGRAAYFWSFLVALMIFLGGGVFSINEGWEKVHHPEPLSHVSVAVIVLLVSLALEAAAALQAIRALNAQRGKIPFFTYLGATTDVDLVVLFAENAAAVVGLVVALVFVGMASYTGDARWDAYGSIAIGGLLTLVAFWLAREVKSLLLGERANPAIETAFREEVAADGRLGTVLRLITIQQGPSQVLLAAKLDMQKGLVSQELVEVINRLEDRVRARCPDVKWQFIEPDNRA